MSYNQSEKELIYYKDIKNDIIELINNNIIDQNFINNLTGSQREYIILNWYKINNPKNIEELVLMNLEISYDFFEYLIININNVELKNIDKYITIIEEIIKIIKFDCHYIVIKLINFKVNSFVMAIVLNHLVRCLYNRNLFNKNFKIIEENNYTFLAYIRKKKKNCVNVIYVNYFKLLILSFKNFKARDNSNFFKWICYY